MAEGDKDWIDRRADAGAQASASAADAGEGMAQAGADAARAGADAAAKAQDSFREHVAEPAARAGEAMRQSGQRMADNGSAIGAKLIDQAEINTSQAFAAMRAAASAKDLGDVMRIQSDYLREQGSRSMAQAREIGELIMELGRQSIAPIGGATRR